MDDGVLDALECVERLANDVLARLREHLDRHVVRDEVVLDEAAQELILCIGGRGEADLDLLEADLEEHLVELELLIEAHRDDECLVAVTHIDTAPDGGMIRRVLLEPINVHRRRQEITLAVFLIVLHQTSLLPNKKALPSQRDERAYLRVTTQFPAKLAGTLRIPTYPVLR